MKIVTLPRPFLANSADTHTDRRQAKQAGWDWGAAHTQPSKIKKSLATRTNNCCAAAARTGSKTENIEGTRERTERKTIHTCLNKNKNNNNDTRHHTTLTTDNNRRPHTHAHTGTLRQHTGYVTHRHAQNTHTHAHTQIQTKSLLAANKLQKATTTNTLNKSKSKEHTQQCGNTLP